MFGLDERLPALQSRVGVSVREPLGSAARRASSRLVCIVPDKPGPSSVRDRVPGLSA